MPAFRKTPLNLALGVALGSLTLVPSLSSAFAPDVSASIIATPDPADTIIGPMYSTVKEPGGGGPLFDPDTGDIIGTADLDAVTSFSITNTSPTQAVLAKVRFREQKRSMEALDFMVLLSPNDQFSGYVSQDGNRGDPTPTNLNPAPGSGGQRPFLQWQDDTCVIGGPIRTITGRSGPDGTTPPILRTYFPPVEGTPDPNPFIDSTEDLSFGHIEVIGMVAFNAGHPMNLASQAKGTGQDAVCQGVRNNLADRGAAQTALAGGADVPNVLTGRFVITASGVGIEYGDNFIPLRNSFNAPYIAPQNNLACTADPFIGAPAGGTYANNANALTHACHSLYAWDNAESAHPHLGDMNLRTWAAGVPQVARLDGLTLANILSGDWSNNGANNVSTDQIITFFDKYVYTDFVNCVQERVAVTPSGTIPSGIMAGTQVREWCLVNYESQSLKAANGPVIGAGGNGRRDLFAKVAGYPVNPAGNPALYTDVFGSPAVAGLPTDTAEGTPFGIETTWGTSYGPLNAGFIPETSLCMSGNYVQMWDIDEREVVVNSPGDDPNGALCDETWVMALLEGDNGGSEAFPSLIQYQDRRYVVYYPPFDTDFVTNRGIFELFLNWQPTVTAAGVPTTGPSTYFGAATSGLLAVQRRTEGPEINNGSLTRLDRIVRDPLVNGWLPRNPLTPGAINNP